MTPYVSVIMPAYNAEKTIARAIESVIHNKGELELIVVNDGSTDGTVDMVKGFLEKDSRVKLFSRENRGVSAARNFGIEKAEGKYLMFIDSDDAFTNGALTEIIEKLESKNTDLLIFGFYSECYNDGILASTNANTVSSEFSFDIADGENNLKYIFSSSKILLQVSWNKVFRSDIVKNNNIRFNESMVCYENLTFIFEYMEHIEKVTALPSIYYKYIGAQFSNSTILKKRRSDNLVHDVSVCFSRFVKICDKYNYSENYRKYMYEQFLNDYTYCSKKIFIIDKSYSDKKNLFINFINDEWYLHLRDHYFGSLAFYRLLYKLADLKMYDIAYLVYKKKILK